MSKLRFQWSVFTSTHQPFSKHVLRLDDILVVVSLVVMPFHALQNESVKVTIDAVSPTLTIVFPK